MSPAKKYNRLIYTIAGIIFIFLLQKQAVLRNDAQHLYEFFSFAPLVLLCTFTIGSDQKSTLKYSLITLIFALGFVLYNRGAAYSLSSRVAAPVTYIKQVVAYRPASHINQPGKRYVPQRVLDIIGNKPVDVFPWDSEYAIENKLNYKPRPVFQSFSAYTEGLEKINYDYFVKQAPDFLIYDYDAIDNRYPFNDESLVNLFIIRNYTLADTFGSNQRQRLILQRKDQTAPLQFIHNKRLEFSLELGLGGHLFLLHRHRRCSSSLRGPRPPYLPFEAAVAPYSEMSPHLKPLTFQECADAEFGGRFGGALVLRAVRRAKRSQR